MAVTLKDIARKLDLSVSSVSLVLNDRPCRIPAETQELIRKTAQELHYIPNLAAQRLVGTQQMLLGMIIPSTRNPHYAAMAHAVTVVSESRGWQCLVLGSDESTEKDLANLRMLISLGVNAIVFVPSTAAVPADYDRYQELLSNYRGSVILGETIRECGLRYSCVSTDHFAVARLTAGHLLELGHRDIAVLAGSACNDPDYRRGMEKAFADCGADPAGLHIYECDYEPVLAYQPARRIVESGSTGVICLNEEYAFVVYDVAREMGRRIPGDLSVIGVNNIYFSRSLSPALTTIDIPGDVCGFTLANSLFDEMGAETAAFAGRRSTYIDAELIVRGSTAPPKNN